MEQLRFEYAAGDPASHRVLVGVVGSGDLEVIIEPGEAGKTSVDVTTSINGYRPRAASGMPSSTAYSAPSRAPR